MQKDTDISFEFQMAPSLCDMTVTNLLRIFRVFPKDAKLCASAALVLQGWTRQKWISLHAAQSGRIEWLHLMI